MAEASPPPPPTRTWGFQTMLLASGASELETTAKSELLKLLSSETRLSSWSCRCSLRVVTRGDVEEIARRTKSEELEAAAAVLAAAECAQMERDRTVQEPVDGADQLAESVPPEPDANKAIGGSPSNPQLPSTPVLENVELTPQILADAFQRLVHEDKTAFLAVLSSGAFAPTAAVADEISAPAPTDGSNGASPLTELITVQESEAKDGAPARIYLLVQYPLSLEEMNALLRIGEAGATAFQGDLPLLPLIDGALLIADPTRALQERRKSLSLGGERRKSISQKHVVTKAIEDALGPAASVLSVFQNTNPLVKACYEASSIGGLEWSDFVFAELPCSVATKESKGVVDLAKELLTSVRTLAAQKYEFKHWVSTTTIIPIPEYSPDSEAALKTLEVYEQILSSVYKASVGVSTVLFAMKEAVVLAPAAGDENNEGVLLLKGKNESSNQSYVEEFIAYSDAAALRLAVAYTTFTKEHLAVGGYDDPCSVLGHKIDGVEKAMWVFCDLPGVGNGGRKGMPIKPLLTPTERSIRDTEFALFSGKFDVPSVHLTRQLLQFEELLGPPWKGKLQSARCFIEELDREILPQRLVQILGNFPTLYKHYDAATDSLLVTTLAATAPGRFRTTAWNAKDHVRHRPAFKDWKKEQLVADEYLTPRTMKALGACVPLSSAELSLLSEKTSVLFPSDQSVIRLYQTPRGYTWLNVYQGGDVFGFRQIDKQKQVAASRHVMQFCASFEDDSQLHIFEGRTLLKKPDGFPTITATNTFPNGLTVTACSDGSIVQQYISAQRQSSSSPFSATTSERGKQDSDSEREIYRLIVGKGAVLREFASGERVVLLANGDVQHIARASRATSKPLASADDDGSEVGKPLRVVDPATNALVEKRPNGVVIVTHTDGSRITHHTDGTRMLTNGAKTHVLVKKPGFADVCIDMQVNLTAQRHARGERVAVTKGGLRTRSIVDVYNGTRIEVSYNTKVIAQVNGRVTTRKPSGICVVAKDSGRIEYRSPRSVATGLMTTEDDDLDVTSHNGVYYFDCLQGRFELCDLEQNQFAIDFADNSAGNSNGSPRVSVDLAGVVSDADAAKYEVDPIPAKAVVNDPIEPHLLILNGDGTGKEILRPRDIESFLREDAAQKKEVYSGFQILSSPSNGQEARASMTQHRVFFQELRLSSDSTEGGESKMLFKDRKLHAEFEKLLQPVNAAAKYLQRFYYPCVQVSVPQFTIVRKLQHIQPFSSTELQEMHEALDKWREWQEAREVNKEQYKVVDPRDDETIALQTAVQKKVLAAYKATRSRKKLKKQKARELLKKKQLLSQGSGQPGGHPGGGHLVAHMETVQEGDEPHVDEKDDESDNDDSDGDGFEDMLSDGVSTNGDDLGDEVDDPEELLWTAFADADVLNTGKLTIAQTRQALVHVLGVGVPTAELTTVLQRYKLQDPQHANLASVFSSTGDGQGANYNNNGNSNNSWSPSSSPRLPVLEGLHTANALVAAGSATEAIRLKKSGPQGKLQL